MQIEEAKEWFAKQGLDIPEPPKIVDNWMLEQFMKCPLLYLMQAANGYRPTERKAALNFGTIIHIGLEVFYGTFQELDYQQRLDAAIAAMEEDWPGDAPGEYRTINAAKSLLVKYADHYNELGDMEPVVIDGHPIVEISGTFSMGDFQYAINTDMLVKHQGEYYVVDHKTTSRMGPSWIKQWHPNNQVTGYAVGVDEIYPLEKPVRGALINGIKMTATGNTEFQRHPTPRTASDKHEWKVNVTKLYEHIKLCHERAIFHGNTQACELYGGCASRDFCESQYDMRSKMLHALYEKDPWDPTNPPGRKLEQVRSGLSPDIKIIGGRNAG